MARLGQQLAQDFCRGFEAKNLRRMVQFAPAFANPQILSTVSTKLSWSHFVAIVALKTPEAQHFDASQAAQERWSVRELAQQIERKAFERSAIAQTQTLTVLPPSGGLEVGPVFKDLYFLDYLDLRQGHDEADLEAAILRHRLRRCLWFGTHRWQASSYKIQADFPL
jgi:hypothetical protein